MKSLLLFCIVSIFCQSIDGSRILCYLQTPGKSHVMLALPLCEGLAARGHQVVMVTNFKFGENTANFTKIVVPVNHYSPELKQMMASGSSTFSFAFMKSAFSHFRATAAATLASEQVQTLMKNEKFDLVIFLNALISNVQLGIADHFKAPYVALSPIQLHQLQNRRFVGSPSLPATVGSQMMNVKGTMNLKERVKNFFFNMFEYFLAFVIDYFSKSDYDTFFPADKYRSYEEMQKNSSLLLLNGHFADSGIIRPLLPNEIEVGGIQIKTKPTPLTGDLKKFLDDAKDGAILWTFGSNVEVSSAQPAKVDTMIKVLSKLKYRVVMKWEIDDKSRLPANAFAQKWLPQASVLAHPNIKLFIGHGGAGGVGEAKYHQVPLLAMPFFADQETNAKKIQGEEWGRSFSLSNVTEENFSEMLNDLLTNQKYRDNVKAYSDKYRDRIASALDTAIFWVEYVLKHHGAPHLQYPGKDLNFFQRHSLDVLGIFVAVLWVVWKVLTCLVKFCFTKCCKTKMTLKNDKKRN